MAHIAPSDLPHRVLSTAHEGELATLALLKRQLSADYTVFHNIRWTNEWESATAFGEADFIIVNRSGAMLIIEQKDGLLKETDGKLIKSYVDGDKDVGAQIHRTVEGIRKKFSWQHGKQSIAIDYLIYCPGYRVVDVNGVGISASRIVDATRAGDLAKIVSELLKPGFDSDFGQKVHRFFEQSFCLVPDVHAHITSNDRTTVRLSEGLAETISCIQMRPLRLKVSGAAGSGKSSVAARTYGQALEQGRRPLLICFNRPLAERMKTRLGRSGGMIETWFGLLTKFLGAKGIKTDFSQPLSPQFWLDLQDRVMGETIPDEWLFDTIIVDEGQDFEPDWFEILRLFSKPDTDFLWLEDPSQKLRDTPELDLAAKGFVGFVSNANHRSPDSIARFLLQALPFNFRAANPLPGLGVGVTAYGEAGEQSDLVGKIITDLVSRGFAHSDIVILSLRGMAHASLMSATRVGTHSLSRFSGNYDVLGNQIFSRGQVLYESVYRFKGQQAPAVILTDIDPSDENLVLHWRLLMCACSRATVRLELLASRTAAANRALFEAAH